MSGEKQSVAERLAAARERKAQRDLEAKQTAEERELAILEAEERFTEELGGRRGEAFDIVDCGAEGFVVLKLGLAVTYKQFHTTIDKKDGPGLTPEACHVFVAPCVHFPDKARFGAIVEKRQGLLYEMANVLEKLYGRNEAADRGKA